MRRAKVAIAIAVALLAGSASAGPGRSMREHGGRGHSVSARPEVAGERAVRTLADCPAGCDDQNPCTDDVCDPQSGCVHSPNTNPCTDGNGCTTNDSCVAGACVGGDPGPGCAPCDAVATIPPGGGTFLGSSSGSSALDSSCGRTETAPERVFSWTPVSSGIATIETCSPLTGFDTAIHVREGECGGPELACNDDGPCATGGSGHEGSRLLLPVVAGQTYFVVVDGYLAASGAFSLFVGSPATCGNGVREGDEECDGADAVACGPTPCGSTCRCAPAGQPDLVPEIVNWFVEPSATVDPGDVAEGCAESLHGSDLLRFGVRPRNLGTADLFLGDPLCPTPCTDHPLELCGNPNFLCSPAGGHNHGHYLDYARYDLLDAAGETVVVGHKQGFCLLDGQDAGPCPGRKYTCNYQGLTVGCADLYEATLGCQYLDVTDIPAGDYLLRVTVDPLDRIAETDEGNNVVSLPVTLARSLCADAVPIPAEGGTIAGATSGGSAAAAGCADTSAAPEKVFLWIPPRSGPARIETCSASGTGFDTALFVRAGACTGPEVGCNDDGPCATSSSPDQGSRVSLEVVAGERYYVFVDGYAGDSGSFELTVVPPPCLPAGAPCDDGDPCTTADSCGDGACAGVPPAPPEELGATLRLEPDGAGSRLAWDDPAGPFVVYRGSLAAGASWTYDHACVAGPFPAPTWTDAAIPAAGDLLWYLVARRGACGESIAGRKSDGSAVPAGPPCP